MALAGEEVGVAGRHHQGTREHAVERRAVVVLAGAQAVARLLLVAVERLGRRPRSADSHLTWVMPYQPGTTRRSGSRAAAAAARRSSRTRAARSARDAPRRAAGCARSRCSTPLDPVVGAGEDARRRRRRASPASASTPSQRDAGPVGRPDRLVEPGLADRPRRPAAPGRCRRTPSSPTRLDAGATGARRATARAARARARRGEAPGRRVHERDVVVDQQVVQPDGRHVVAQRLERHAVVARRELELLQADAHVSTVARHPPAAVRRTAPNGRAYTQTHGSAPDHPARRPGRGRQEHDRLRARRRPDRPRRGAGVPARRASRRRPRAAGLRLPARATGAGDRPHARARGPRRRAAVRAARGGGGRDRRHPSHARARSSRSSTSTAWRARRS